MSAIRTCLACGLEDRDVSMTLVNVPLADQRVVDVAIPVDETHRGVAGFEYRQVREEWIAEPRCRDTLACAARVKALDPEPEPAPDPEPVAPDAELVEEPAWML